MKKNECGDGANMTDIYADNAIFMPPGDTNLNGKEGRDCFYYKLLHPSFQAFQC